MFFKDDDGAQAVLFGEESIVMGNFVLPVDKPKFAGVLLGDKVEGTIQDMKGKTSAEIHAKIRLCFERVEDVDLLIDNLKKVKKALGNIEVSRIFKPGHN
tara:strand:- start:356 stop:655 length:300 start_codon:yes stop_codon:yes gene_type:complete